MRPSTRHIEVLLSGGLTGQVAQTTEAESAQTVTPVLASAAVWAAVLHDSGAGSVALASYHLDDPVLA